MKSSCDAIQESEAHESLRVALLTHVQIIDEAPPACSSIADARVQLAAYTYTVIFS